MVRTPTALAAAAGTLGLLPGCGSSKSTTGSSAPAATSQATTAFGASWYVLAPSGNKVDNS